MQGIERKASEMHTLRVRPPSGPSTIRADPCARGSNKAVFIDRDGVLCADESDRTDPSSMTIIHSARKALEGFGSMGFLRLVVTNQGGMALGSFTQDDMLSFTRELWEKLGDIGPPWDAYYYCPYHAEGVIEPYIAESIDRKPGPGMLLRAALEHDVDLPSSFMIGDHLKDIIAGHRAGCRAILVTTGRGEGQMERIMQDGIRYGDEAYPDAIVEDIGTAYELIREWER